MDFMKEYEKWLASPALSGEEKAESGDETPAEGQEE